MSEKKTKVLLVDDDLDFLKAAKKLLLILNYEVQVCEDGSKVKGMLKKDIPDVLVLDVMMPGIDGYQICKELKTDADYSFLPIILLTAVAEKVTTTRYSHQGGKETLADDFVCKGSNTIVNLNYAIQRLIK